MFGFFRSKKPVLDEEIVKNHKEYFDQIKTIYGLDNGDLVLPTKEYFPDQAGKKKNDLAEYYLDVLLEKFQIIKSVTLKPDNSLDAVSVARRLPIINSDSGFPSSYVEKDRKGYVIHYAPSLIKYPGIVVANMATHLSTIVRDNNKEELNAGEESLDRHLSIIMGFGVFILNMQNQFQPFNRSVALRWHNSVRKASIKSELCKDSFFEDEIPEYDEKILFAIYLKQKEIDINTIKPFLDKNLGKFIKDIYEL